MWTNVNGPQSVTLTVNQEASRRVGVPAGISNRVPKLDLSSPPRTLRKDAQPSHTGCSSSECGAHTLVCRFGQRRNSGSALSDSRAACKHLNSLQSSGNSKAYVLGHHDTIWKPGRGATS
uniref:Uncharacterized protein n=1 Tax=Anguilla anguilla TaxID=7936 RepID=A0A0E9X558_ANGAN